MTTDDLKKLAVKVRAIEALLDLQLGGQSKGNLNSQEVVEMSTISFKMHNDKVPASHKVDLLEEMHREATNELAKCVQIWL